MPTIYFTWLIIFSILFYYTPDRDEVLIAGLILLTLFIIYEAVATGLIFDLDRIRLRVNASLARNRISKEDVLKQRLIRIINFQTKYFRKVSKLDEIFLDLTAKVNGLLRLRASVSANSLLATKLQLLDRTISRRDTLLEYKLILWIRKAFKRN